MAVELAPAHWRDVPRLVSLERDVYGADAWSQRSWWSELAARPRRAYVTARVDGDVVGYAGVDLGPDVADVMTVTLAPEARGRRLGHALMSWLVRTAARTRAGDLMLEVGSNNAAALALYSAWGFCQVGVRRHYYHQTDALVLRRPLTPEDREDVGSAFPREERGWAARKWHFGGGAPRSW